LLTSSSTLQGIAQCSRAVISKGKKDRVELLVEGQGLKQVMVTPGVIGRLTKSNHIMEVEKVLGIEAARQTIVDEITHTMSEHGLTVDPRHLGLLADTMTVKVGFEDLFASMTLTGTSAGRGLGHHSIWHCENERFRCVSSSSREASLIFSAVLMLASFEKTTDHLFEGAFYSKRDAIHGVSECIIMGNPANFIGTSLYVVH
jgi:DNA-directed RNA polymerase III subunit RPC1